MALFEKILRAGEGRMLRRLQAVANAVNSIEDHYTDLTDDELRELTDQYKERYADGESLDFMELVAYLIPRMAYFAVPRYIRILPQLPKTPTQKILKHLLRTEGVTPDTWDREKTGVHLRRERLRPCHVH